MCINNLNDRDASIIGIVRYVEMYVKCILSEDTECDGFRLFKIGWIITWMDSASCCRHPLVRCHLMLERSRLTVSKVAKVDQEQVKRERFS